MPADDSPLSSITGQARYLLKQRIASGGMGAVYEAEQLGVEGFSKTIAIKTILDHYARSPMFIKLFIDEAKLVADLVHPNIVQIYQLDRYEKGYFIAMEYIEGITLAQLIRLHKKLGRTLPVDLATFIVSRVCRGLEYAHNKKDRQGRLLGVVHRDVCPRNILVSREGEIKLTDFGVAKARNYMQGLSSGMVVGKEDYMSPEQSRGQPVDGRSDLFSLGAVYFELLTGVNPRRAGRHGQAVFPFGQRLDVPAEVLEILQNSLAEDPQARYVSADEMGTALEMQMYVNGYGPTIVKLARYLDGVVPGVAAGLNTDQQETVVARHD